MTRWDEKVQLGDVFHNDAMSFDEIRDEVIRRLRRTRWVRYSFSAADLMDELAETSNPQEFNEVWNEIYDLADFDRIWIDTASKPVTR